MASNEAPLSSTDLGLFAANAETRKLPMVLAIDAIKLTSDEFQYNAKLT